MKPVILLLATLCIGMTAPVFAQSADNNNEPIDEIIVEGSRLTDPAMSAFLSGDFETAEIEFDKNAFCALRRERGFRAGVEGARDSSIRGELNANTGSAPQPLGGPGGGPVTVPDIPTIAPSINVNSSEFTKNEIKRKRNCEDRGYQVYMKGMSQLQLGKTAEAKKTLSQATKIHRTLFDAHFRLSLLQYQDGNLEKAQKELKKLQKIEARCKRCESKEEIKSQVKYLDKLLKK